MSQFVVYQKKTCITCKKALAYLAETGVDCEIKDIITDPPSADMLHEALDEKDLKASLNSRSSLYKEKSLGKATLSKADAIRLMQSDPNLIKRPFIVRTNKRAYYQGFDPDSLQTFLKG